MKQKWRKCLTYKTEPMFHHIHDVLDSMKSSKHYTDRNRSKILLKTLVFFRLGGFFSPILRKFWKKQLFTLRFCSNRYKNASPCSRTDVDMWTLKCGVYSTMTWSWNDKDTDATGTGVEISKHWHLITELKVFSRFWVTCMKSFLLKLIDDLIL